MRLICGTLHLDGSAASGERLVDMARRMTGAELKPRVSTWHGGPCGLAIVDFSRSAGGELRLEPDSAGHVLAADVRLDSLASLARSVQMDSTEPVALLKAALLRWGATAPSKVGGDFAFAWWSAGSRMLVCGRDIFGVRPFVYAFEPGRLFAFASLARGLLGSVIEPVLDEAALVRQVVRNWQPEETLFANLRRLPAAHILELSAGRVSVRPYWRLEHEVAEVRHVDAEDAGRELRRVLEEAVEDRLPAGMDVAAHLSGGLDSSAVSIIAGRSLRGLGRRLHVFSYCVPDARGEPENPEMPYIRAVLEQEPDLVWKAALSTPVAIDARMDIERLTPIESAEPDNAVCARASDLGVETVLSGWGGDEGASHSGRGAVAEAFLRGRWGTVHSEVAALARLEGSPMSRIFLSEVVRYLTPDWVGRAKNMLLSRSRRAPDLTRSFFSKAVLDRLGDGARPNAPTLGPDGRGNRLRLLSSPHLVARVEDWAAVGARRGVAFSFPLLDRRVVELAASLPSGCFLREGFTRRLFRDAMRGVLPELVRSRTSKRVRMPHPVPLAIGLANRVERYVEEAAAHPRVREIFNVPALLQAARTMPAPEALLSGTADSERVLAFLRVLRAVGYVAQHY